MMNKLIKLLINIRNMRNNIQKNKLFLMRSKNINNQHININNNQQVNRKK